MLYLWPFFAFFSAPLVIPSAMTSLSSFYEAVRNAVHRTPSTMAEANSKKSLAASKSAGLRVADFFVRRIFYACFLVGALGLSVCIVGYNTIIHPFTLADNRHYMFYVFRYTIRRSQLVRFSLIGAYMLSGHLIWNRLAGNPSAAQGRLTPLVNRPFASVTSARKRDAQNEDVPSPATASPATSTALLWLGTTTLSLVTAPLVEPRYFILPWIFWRLLVPAWPTPSTLPERLRGTPGVDWLSSVMRRVDLTLALETTWFVVINLATFWVFLYRPYQWRGADGQLLDEGRWQRFMW
jgi:alpha-1,2-glucosyltransferase